MGSPLLRRRDKFRRFLEGEKKALRQIAWYPYQTLTAFDHIDHFFAGDPGRLVELAQGRPVLDVGCGDGDLSFFLADLGLAPIHALENPLPNYNGLRGVYALKSRLRSRVEVIERDIDQTFELEEKYGLAFCLGVLYHLKNPFLLLERLAVSCAHCVLSTRIFDAPGDAPVAYLVGEDEVNADSTNCWIFSESGLRRLVERAGWRVLDWHRSDAGRVANPVRPDGDVRVYALLASTATDPARSGRLLYGWHALENRSWRWTERRFGIQLPAPARDSASDLVLRFALQPAILARATPLRITAKIDGIELIPLEFDRPGEHEARWQGAAGDSGAPVRVEFEASHALTSPNDPRELCLNVVGCHWESPSS